jgi:hypothetical protein
VRYAPGSIFVLYTDVVGDDADERTELLESTVAGLPPGSAADEVVERVVSVCLPHGSATTSRCWWCASTADLSSIAVRHSQICHSRI